MFAGSSFSAFAPIRRAARAAVLAGAALTLAGAAAAQAPSVRGQVLDAETRQPVSAVAVDLLGTGNARVANTITDDAGRFELAGAPAGTYSIVLSRLGYAIRRIDGVRVTTDPVDLGAITLVSRALQLNPVVVTPSRVEEKAVRAPASTWVVDERQVRGEVATSPADHVKEVPGVDVATTGVTQNSVVARGFNNVFSGSLLVLTDHRWASVPSLRFNAYNLIPVTDEDIERIELALGPGSALYGPNVNQGVLHILTRSPLDQPGTTVSVMGGEREIAQITGRHAASFGGKFGVKLSGSWLRGRDWIFRDSVEDSLRALAIARGARPDTLRIGARDFDAERFSGDVRMDWLPAPETRLVLGGGFSQLGSSIELTGIGAAQGVDWRSSYAQARLSHRRLFVQSYLNFSNAGDSYTLRDGGLLVDRSVLLVSQIQHDSSPWERERLVYGVDFIRTLPRTEGTITGRNEDDDDITEIGGYVQSETRLSDRFDLVAAARLDHHSRVEDLVFSPRAGVVAKVKDGHNVRLTYNRAFSQPTSNSLFLDIRSARDFGGLPFDVRVTGVPETGFQFARDPTGRPLMRSPFTPAGLGGPAQQLPLDATVFWPVVVQILQSRGIDISGVPPPTAADVSTVMRSLNPTTRAFERVGDVADIEPLRPQITNTIEAGYKGFFGNRASVGVDVHYSQIKDFISPLLVATPNAFLEFATLRAYLANYLSPAQAAQIAAAVAGIDANASVTGIPLGTVTPIRTVGDPYDLFLAYRNFAEVHLFGFDCGSTVFASDQLSFTGAYSFVHRNLWERRDGIADISLNAPKHKVKLSANYRDDRSGWSGELRGRFIDAFPVNSGVYIGRIESYTLLDASVGYVLPFARSTELTLAATNVLDDRHREFIGAPELGRLVFLRARTTF